MEDLQVSKSCHVCMIRSVQEKMEKIILVFPELHIEDEEKALSNYLTLLKSKSDQMLSFVQIILKVKNELSVALMDLERSKESSEKHADCVKRVSLLNARLKRISKHCDHFFMEAETDINTELSDMLETSLSPEVLEALKSSAKSEVFCKCFCEKKEDVKEATVLRRVKKTTNNILSYCDKNMSAKKSNLCNSPPRMKMSKTSIPHIEISSEASHSSQGSELDYWKSDHHRHEWFNFQRTLNPLSWHALSTSQCDSFIKKGTKSPISTLPKIEKPDTNYIPDYNKMALDQLVERLQNLYFCIENAAISSTDNAEQKTSLDSLKALHKKRSVKKNILPKLSPSDILSAESSKSELPKDLVTINRSFFDENSGKNMKQRSKFVYPRPPSVWCDEIVQTSDLNLKQAQQKQKLGKSTSSMRELKEKLPKSRSPIDKKSTIKRAVARVRAVAKIKRQFCTPIQTEDYLYAGKVDRIKDLLGPNGLQSKTKNVVIDAAKSLGQLRFVKKDEIVAGLISVIDSEKKIAAYESSKSLILLGVWDKKAMKVITESLQNGNSSMQKDLLATIQQSPDTAFISKQSTSLLELSSALENLLENDDDKISLDAALCLGHLCINNDVAKIVLLNRLNSTDNHVISKVLTTLIKQMNCKDDMVIECLLKQIQVASSWKVRLQGLQLLRFVGLRRLQKFGIDRVSNVLQELLWNHPNQEFRHEVGELLKEFNLYDHVCNDVLKKLLDTDEYIRAAAVISLSTLEMKGDRELKLLLDMLDLDSSNYVRTQVIRAFKALEWNCTRVIRALNERQKGDDALANEATQALKVLLS